MGSVSELLCNLALQSHLPDCNELRLGRWCHFEWLSKVFSWLLYKEKKDPADSSQSRLQDSVIKVITVQSKRTWRRHVSHPDISPWSYAGPLCRRWSSQIPWQLWITHHYSKCPEKHWGHGHGADQTACIRIRYILSLLSFNLDYWGCRRKPQGC